MNLQNDIELTNTREKLRELGRYCEERRRETPINAYVHQLTLQSLKRLVNQLKEEIARYEAHHPVGG